MLNEFMGWHKVEWEVRRQSGVTHGEDSVYLDKGETGTI